MAKRSLSRREFLRVSATAIAGTLAVACQPVAAPSTEPGAAAQPAAQAIELTYWKPPHGDDATLFAPLLQEFTAQNPNLKVAHNVIPWGSVDEQFTAAFAGGDPPDVFYLPDEWYPKYVRQGQIADITPLVSDLESNYDPNVWAIGTYKGKVYGVPFLGVIHALLLNMSLFGSKGLGVPQSWDEIRAAAQELTSPGEGTYGIEMPSGWTFLVPLLATGGTQVLSDDLTRVTANTPGGVAAWEIALQQIAWEDQSSVPTGFTADQRQDLALQGKIGMMWREQSGIKAVWRKQAPDIELDVIPLPKVEGTDGQPATWTNVGFLFIAQNSKHKEEAVKLLEFLASKQVQERYVVQGVDLMSPMKGIETPPEEMDPIVEKFLSYLPLGVGTQISVHWREATDALVQESQAVMSGQKTTAQALTDFENLINPLLDGE